MATEHEEKSLLCHRLSGDDSIQYSIVKSLKLIEQAAKCVSCRTPLPAEQETIFEYLEGYLNSYAVTEGKLDWLAEWGDSFISKNI